MSILLTEGASGSSSIIMLIGYIVIFGAAAGLILVSLMISIAKRISVKAEDSEETEFFD